MPNPILFKDLPATFPERDKYQKPSIASSVLFHVLLVLVLVIVPLMFPKNVDQWQLLTLLEAPLPPPPAALPAPVKMEAAAPKPTAATPVDIKPAPQALVMPLAIPRDIAHIVEAPIDVRAGVAGGVPGGMPGGAVGGILGGILASNARAEMALPPPPPPPPPPAPAAPTVPKGPIHVGGDVREPQIIKLVPPVYPALALKARVSGEVVLEATLTKQGTVEDIRVISGHPLLINAAIDCVKQWVYEPTYLNGQPVAVILTAKVLFRPRPAP